MLASLELMSSRDLEQADDNGAFKTAGDACELLRSSRPPTPLAEGERWMLPLVAARRVNE